MDLAIKRIWNALEKRYVFIYVIYSFYTCLHMFYIFDICYSIYQKCRTYVNMNKVWQSWGTLGKFGGNLGCLGDLGALWGALGRGPGLSLSLQNVQIHDARAHAGHASILSRPLSIQSEQHVLTLSTDIKR